MRVISVGWGISILIATAGVASADLVCENPKVTTENTTIGGKTFQKITTPIDDTIRSDCSDVWSNPLDSWRYGEFYALFEQKIFATEKAREQWTATRQQPKLTRAECSKNGATAGYYAYEYRPKDVRGPTDTPGLVRGDMDLHFLCVPPAMRGGGVGVDLANAAVDDALGKVLPGQKLALRIVALPSAVSFYDRLLLDCTEEDAGEGRTAYVYSATIARGQTPAIGRKTAIWQPQSGCVRVKFGCITLADYNQAIQDNHIEVNQNCESKQNPKEISFKEAVSD